MSSSRLFVHSCCNNVGLTATWGVWQPRGFKGLSFNTTQKLWTLARVCVGLDEVKIGISSMVGQMEMGYWKPRGTQLSLTLPHTHTHTHTVCKTLTKIYPKGRNSFLLNYCPSKFRTVYYDYFSFFFSIFHYFGD